MDARTEDPRGPSEPVPRVHANALEAHGGPFDLTLDFGYRANPDVQPEGQVRVTMSWEHALAMVKALQAMVDDYQAHAGALPDLERLRLKEGA